MVWDIFNEKYYIDLVTQEPINYNGLIIHQPSFKEIKDFGIDLYNQIMLLYSLTLDCFDGLPDNKEDINIFNDVILNDNYLLYCLSESLYFLTKADSITLYQNSKTIELKFIDVEYKTIEKEVQRVVDIEEIPSLKTFIKKCICFIVGKRYKVPQKIITETICEEIEEKSERIFKIDSSNFDDISDIILKINGSKKVEIEKPPANMSPRQRDIWEKLQEGRRNDAKKNEVHIYDVLNVCEYCGDYRIPIEELKTWSLWRIMNCYKTRLNIKSYDDNLQIALVSGDSKSISGENHWHHQLMIRE